MLLFAALILTALFCRRVRKTAVPSSPEQPLAVSPWKAAAACYAVQACFSFSVSMVAPMFWVVLGLCVFSDA